MSCRMHHFFPIRLYLVIVSCFLVVGCGDGGPELYEISGTVTIDGEPLSKGAVRFVPLVGEQSVSAIAEDGSFTLKCRDKYLGAYPGEHRITVYAAEALGETKIRWFAPKEYAYPATTPLKEVIEGPNENMELKLEWGKKKGPYDENLG